MSDTLYGDDAPLTRMPSSALSPVPSLTSANSEYVLCFLSDGNLVVYHIEGPRFRGFWQSDTAGGDGVSVSIDSESLVMKNSVGDTVWEMGAGHGHFPGSMKLENDGALTIFNAIHQQVWKSTDDHRTGWQKFCDWWSDAVNAVADFFVDVFNSIGDVIADVIETIGTAIATVFLAIGHALRNVPILGAFFTWVGDAISGATSFIAATTKALFNTVGEVISGVLKVVGGLVIGNWNLMLDGVKDIFVTGIAGSVVTISGTFLDLFQGIFTIQSTRRALTKDEIAVLKKIFHNSLALYNIRIVEDRNRTTLLSLNGARAITLANTIHMQNSYYISDGHGGEMKDYKLLAHESTHCWQYQNYGTTYMIRSLMNNGDAGYDWKSKVDPVFDTPRWADLYVEAEAQFVEDTYQDGAHINPMPPDTAGNGIFFDQDESSFSDDYYLKSGNDDYTIFARDSISYIRGYSNHRLSRFFI